VRAAEFYERVLALDPGNRYALMGLGDLFQRMHRHEEALGCWERLLALDPNHAHVQAQVGQWYRRKLDFERAASHFRVALSLDPDHALALFGLADALRGMGSFEEAAPLWDAVLQADPGNRQALTRAGDCFCRLGRLDKAEGLYRKVLAMGFDRAAEFGLARVQLERGAFDEAVRRYEKVLAADPEDPRAILQKGQALTQWRGRAAGLAYLEAQRASHPGVQEIAHALDRLGRKGGQAGRSG
jgi:pentatricopeptide repeat protein